MVPETWQVTEVNDLTSGDSCIAGDDGNGGSGTVEVAPVGGDCNDQDTITIIEWFPDPSVGISSLNVVLETRPSPGGLDEGFLPALCGPLTLNDGATAFEVDEFEELVRGDDGSPIVVFGPTEAITLVAVEDLDDGGIVPDGSGDEDGDGVSDADEVLNDGTDPCTPIIVRPEFDLCWSEPCPAQP